MVILANSQSSSSAVIYSGLIAAFVSGIVSILGYCINAYFQNRNNKETIKTQKEIAKMGENERLFYQSQLNWSNETRKLIAKFVQSCILINRQIKSYKQLDKKVHDAKNIEEANPLIDQYKELIVELKKLTGDLQEQITLIRLYLFHDDDMLEKNILLQILNMEQHYSHLEQISDTELDSFVNLVRSFFNKQMKELRDKTA